MAFKDFQPMMNYKHPMYKAWKGMRNRCNSVTHERYKDYGARGIYVNTSWDDFKQFVLDMGDRPRGMSLDRIDNNGPYSKENCRWATPTQQNRNSRRCKITLETAEQIRKEPRNRGRPKKGNLTYMDIAKKYGITYRNVKSVLDGDSWT